MGKLLFGLAPRVAFFCIISSSCLLASPLENTKIAFLTAESCLDDLGYHSRAAWETLASWGQFEILFASDKNEFVDSSGRVRQLGEFDAVWYHQGDDVSDNVLYRGTFLGALSDFSRSGKGVLLSGGALELVLYLGLEREIRPQRHYLENYRDPATMIIVEKTHPVFLGFGDASGEVPLSAGGCRAVADFYWGGPAEGMVLANSPQGVHKPLVEYALGKGRILVFGWRWPDYADTNNPHRENLLLLTKNLLYYAAHPETWKSVRIPTKFPQKRFSHDKGIPEERFLSLRRAIDYLQETYPETYPNGNAFQERLKSLQADQMRIEGSMSLEKIQQIVQSFETLQREALLANPLLDFEKILMIRRRADQPGLPMNSYGNDALPPTGYDNTIVSLEFNAPNLPPQTLFTPPGDVFIGDLDLHYDARKLLMSIPDGSGKWGISELSLDTGAISDLPLIEDPDVHNYDACYLPDDRVVFTSTAPFIGVPCVGGRSKVANLYLRETDGRIRRLTNDQDHNWCPAVLNDGRILYQRWEYADIAHAFMRILFSANPDGSRQMEYYGSNSFWPTAMFYARPVPGHSTRFVAIAGGHHDAPRQGELILFDTRQGRHEADGVVQRIPGHGEKVEPVILDGLIATSWPRFLHPFPLSDTFFLVSCKPEKDALWGVYLVDRFDNFILIHEETGYAMLEPIPWKKSERQPVIPDSVKPASKTSIVQLADVYHGPGLKGIPRGTVKHLRLIGYEYTFHDFGGEPDRVGLDGPWDVRRIIGTVPVESDGSANFTVPALTPIAVQPLDAEGKAMALMRSWFTAAPGELLSCAGCHEPQNSTAPPKSLPEAFKRPPSDITPWYGPARGFSFQREIQPVLNKYCLECHHGGNDSPPPDFSDKPVERIPSAFQMHFSPAYMALRSWVHTPTLESDAHMLPPADFHADTSPLIQMLRDGHYGVELDQECQDRLITWIDLNAPFHGSWQEVIAYDPVKLAAAKNGAERRKELHQRYTGLEIFPDVLSDLADIAPPATPVNPNYSQRYYDNDAPPSTGILPGGISNDVLTVSLAPTVDLELVCIQPGSFSFGSNSGFPNEHPESTVEIPGPFYMARFETTNRQFACFNPSHDSGLETGEAYQFGDDERGFLLNRPEQPVVRVSWDEASAFCLWLSELTGREFSLPTEEQWEYACRAGTASAFWYGSLDSDFSTYANLSDATHYSVYYPHVPTALPPWRPADTRFNDQWRVSAPSGSFLPNPWGLYDMHGNVSEWTLTSYQAQKDCQINGSRKIVRGGSWLDIPKRARSAFRQHYNSFQAIHDVGFRVVCSFSSR